MRFEIGEDDGGGAFAEAEGGFEGFGEAGFGGGVEGEAVLDDGDDGGEFFAFQGGGFVGAEGFAVEPDAEVALGLEEGEEVGG